MRCSLRIRIASTVLVGASLVPVSSRALTAPLSHGQFPRETVSDPIRASQWTVSAPFDGGDRRWVPAGLPHQAGNGQVPLRGDVNRLFFTPHLDGTHEING